VIRVLVVDDHPVVLAALVRLLEVDQDIEVVGSAADGELAVRLDAELAVDVVLMDLAMPGIGGIEATRRIVGARPDARVVLLSASCTPELVLAALDAHAIGYLLKEAEPWQLVAGVRAAAAGGSPMDPEAASILVEERAARKAAMHLRPRELEVLRLVAAGLLNKQIARSMGISEKTVKAHLGHVYEQLGVTGRSAAVRWAQQHQLLGAVIDPDDPDQGADRWS
jgi:DNA-binding NarL/FixJ family response regulator